MALALQSLRVPVLVHGALAGGGGVTAVYWLLELGACPRARACARAIPARRRQNRVPTAMLAPALAELLALKCHPGIGDITQFLARLLTPFNREALKVATPNGDGERVAARIPGRVRRLFKHCC